MVTSTNDKRADAWLVGLQNGLALFICTVEENGLFICYVTILEFSLNTIQRINKTALFFLSA